MEGKTVIDLRNIDARDGLRSVMPETVDCIVSDIPYRTISGGNTAPGRPVGVLSANDGKVFDHNDIDISEYAYLLFRVLTDPGHCWLMVNELNRRKVEDEMLRVGFKTHFLGAWVKNNCTPNRWGMKNGELIFLFRKGRARTLYTPGLKQFMQCDNVRDKLHPTEKPVELMRKLVEASSKPGEIVLDPFAGSGSTGVAASETGRRFLGFEIDPAHHATASRRLGLT